MKTKSGYHSFSEPTNYPFSSGQKAILEGQNVYIKSANQNQESKMHLSNEMFTLSRLPEIKSILHPIDCTEEHLVFPFITTSLIDFCGKLSEEQILKTVLIPLLESLESIHNKNIVHADIKLENIRVDEELKIYLADFGRAKNTLSFNPNKITALSQHQPADITFSPMYDIYSVGVLTYQLFLGIEFMRDFQLKGREFCNIPESKKISSKMKEFIHSATTYDASLRFKSATHAIEFLSGPPENSIHIQKFNLNLYYEVYLEFMKQTFQASLHPMSRFNDFVGTDGSKYYQRLRRWGDSPDALIIHIRKGWDIIGILEASIPKSGSGLISTLFVRSDYRGQGYAELLEENALTFFKSKGCEVVSLNVDLQNLRGIAYYKKTGWIPAPQSNYPDSICFQKKINS